MSTWSCRVLPPAGSRLSRRRWPKRSKLPLIAKDTIEDALMEQLGTSSIEASRELGRAAVRVLLAVARQCPEAPTPSLSWPSFPSSVVTGLKAESGALHRLHEPRLLMARLPDMLEAPPVQLHRWRQQHVAALIDAVNASRPELAVWMPWAKEEPTPEEYAVVLARFDEAFDAGTEFVFGIFVPRLGVAGGCGLHLRGEPEVAEIGYWVRTDCHRRGYATAAARALTTAAFDHLDAVGAVYIAMDEANVASAGVAAKLGYRLERTEAREVLAPGHTGKGLRWIVERGTWSR